MKTKDIHQTEMFNADPEKVYDCIMNAEHHSEFTGDDATIQDKQGAEFTAFSGYVQGKNMQLEKGKKIVQQWRAEEDGLPEDHFSEVTFLFEKVKDGTKMEFYQKGIPERHAKDIEKGWKDFYWEPLKEYLEG